MAKNQKKRSEISDEFKWDLTKIYKNIDEFNSDYKEVEDKINSISKYENILMDSADNLYEFLKLNSYIESKFDKLYVYSTLHHDEDTTNPFYQELYGRMENLSQKFNNTTSFFKPVLLNYSYDKIEEFYKENKNLLEYEFVLEQYFRYKEHNLSKEESKIMSELSKILEANYNTYELLVDTDMKFGLVKDENGEEVELTKSNYSKFIESKNRDVRKSAFERLYNTYGSYKNTITSLYKTQVDKEYEMAKIYNFNSALEQSLFNDNIGINVYDNLINTVNKNLSELYKYYEFRKEYLKLDEQHLYDVYVNLLDTKSKEYSFDEAKELVIKALSVLGEDYIEIIKKAFDEKWIDVYNNVGKRGGAYSGGSYETFPYILLNFENDLDDVSTLAHELGHSVHSYYSRKNNSYDYADYKIFVAEIASTVNELLLNKYILNNSKDNDEKLLILNKQLELFKGTIFRQTMFAEFERDMHKYTENGEILTSEFINKKYYDLVKKYFGDSVYVDEEIKYEWTRVPHFYYNFYVYKYATGLSIASHIVSNILKGDKEYLEKYKTFLKSGSSMYPLNELKILDIDMSDSKVVESAIEIFKETLNELKKITK